MRLAAALLAPALLLAAASAPTLAHHGWGSYDSASLLTLSAPIIEANYQFPHGEIVIEVEGKRWHVILAPPSRMERRGIVAADLAVGTEVTVEGYPSTAEEGELRAERILLNGRTIELR
jgi:hypothetical protein